MTSTFALQPVVWLVAMQFLLYAGAWSLVGLLMRGQRRPALYWAAFMVLVGTGFWLASLRGEPRHWLAYGGSNTAFLASYVMLWRGLESFFDMRRRGTEQALVLAAVVAGFALLGSDVQHAPARVLLAYGGGALIMLRLFWLLREPLDAEFGPRAMHLVAAPAYLMLVALTARALQQLADWGTPQEMHLNGNRNVTLLFAYLVGAAMFNASFVALMMLRALRRLEDLSRRDALTGLLNRRALDDVFAREWRRFRRSGDPVSVVALDLDHFKRVNDEHGHEAGDRVLEHAARQLRAVARGSDVVARSGGEEFVLLMPGAAVEGARAAADRLLQRLRSEACRVGPLPLVVTASAGVAQASGDDTGLHDALRRADRALYRAKAEGRDRVAVAAS